MAHLIRPEKNATPELVTSPLTIAAIQAAVKGYFEVVPVSHMVKLNGVEYKRPVLLVNEDGIRLQLPPNKLATHLAGRLIVGTVLLANVGEV